MRKLLCVTCLTITFLFIVVTTVYSESIGRLPQLQNCNAICTESNSSGAYVYGYRASTLYSARILPQISEYTLTVDGKIRAVTHNGNKTYALFKSKHSTCYLAELNLDTGKVNYYNVGLADFINFRYIAVDVARFYILKSDSVYCYAESYDFNGNKINTFKFNSNIIRLLSDNYAQLDNGDVYKLGDNGCRYCTNINPDFELTDFGNGYVYDSNGAIISLGDNEKKYVETKMTHYAFDGKSAVMADKHSVYLADNYDYYSLDGNIMLLLAHKNKVAVVTTDYNCITASYSEFKSVELEPTENSVKPSFSDGSNIRINCGTSLSAFKKDTGAEKVYDKHGKEVTRGFIRTGCRADIGGTERVIIVSGDLVGTGEIKSNDVTALMQYFSGKTNLDDAQLMSADYNIDGEVDNKDLVLIARKAECSQ